MKALDSVKPSRAIPLALLAGVLVRAPFWIEALKTPVDGDTAIVGLMARHLGEGTSLWGQPYGSPLDAWVAAPFVAALGPRVAALRFPVFLLGLALVPLAYGLGRALDPRAALPAALLLACPPPYLLLLSALPPPFYATTLVLCGLLLLLALRLGPRLAAGEPATAGLLGFGGLAGLALWTHLMSASAVAAGLLWMAWRARAKPANRAVAPGPRPRSPARRERALLDPRPPRPPGHPGGEPVRPRRDDGRAPGFRAAAPSPDRGRAVRNPRARGGGRRRARRGPAPGGGRPARRPRGPAARGRRAGRP